MGSIANFILTNKYSKQQIPIDLHILQAITEEIRDGDVNVVRDALAENPNLHLMPEIARTLLNDYMVRVT